MTTRILFNEDCPICNAEICHYQKYAETNDIELYFDQLGKADLSVYGVNKDQAAKTITCNFRRKNTTRSASL